MLDPYSTPADEISASGVGGAGESRALLAELKALAQAYRDELVLERFQRRQLHAQLQRRVSVALSQQQQQQQRSDAQMYSPAAANGSATFGFDSVSPAPGSASSSAGGFLSPLAAGAAAAGASFNAVLLTPPPAAAPPRGGIGGALAAAGVIGTQTPPPPPPAQPVPSLSLLHPSHLEMALDLKVRVFSPSHMRTRSLFLFIAMRWCIVTGAVQGPLRLQ
jgi:hypothetical protein